MTVTKGLVHYAVISADDVAIGFQGTNADKTTAILERALEALEANGLIVIKPTTEWPHFYAPFPPYEGISAWRSSKGVEQ